MPLRKKPAANRRASHANVCCCNELEKEEPLAWRPLALNVHGISGATSGHATGLLAAVAAVRDCGATTYMYGAGFGQSVR